MASLCDRSGNALYDAETVARYRPAPITFVLLALLFGAALRLYFFAHWPQVNGDGLIYGDIAKNLLQHGIYGRTVDGAAHPTLIRLPGYPLFVALVFLVFGVEHYNAILFLQIAIDLATCLLIALFVRRLCSTRAAWIALYLAALCPFTANYTVAPLTETLSLFFIAVAMLALVRMLTKGDAASVFLSALSWSSLTLLRPDGALLPIAFFPAILWYACKPVLGFPAIGLRRAIRLACISGMLSVLPFLAWTYRNWHTFHLIQPLAPRYANDPGEDTDPGMQRWTKTWAAEFASTSEVYWNVNSDVIPFNALPDRAFDSPSQKERTAALIAAYNKTTTLSPELDDAFGQLAAERIHAHPLRYYVWLPALRVTNMWLRPRTEILNVELRWWQYSQHHVETIFATVYAGLNLFYMVAAAIGLLRWRQRGEVRFIAAMLGYLLLRNLLLATIEAPEARYTLEGFPMVIAWASAAFSRCHIAISASPAHPVSS